MVQHVKVGNRYRVVHRTKKGVAYYVKDGRRVKTRLSPVSGKHSTLGRPRRVGRPRSSKKSKSKSPKRSRKAKSPKRSRKAKSPKRN
jgi:hypothetical protein